MGIPDGLYTGYIIAILWLTIQGSLLRVPPSILGVKKRSQVGCADLSSTIQPAFAAPESLIQPFIKELLYMV